MYLWERKKRTQFFFGVTVLLKVRLRRFSRLAMRCQIDVMCGVDDDDVETSISCDMHRPRLSERQRMKIIVCRFDYHLSLHAIARKCHCCCHPHMQATQTSY